MRVPFTVGEFFDVFALYNRSVWPMQVVLLALAVVALVLVYVRAKGASRGVSLILAFLWAWMGVAYHFAQFASINPAAKLFGALFIVQAVLFVWLGVSTTRITFRPAPGAGLLVGWALILYGLVLYPLLGRVAGHPYMVSPTFGVPCPTTIFTFGVLWFMQRPFPRYVLIIPIVWSLIGGSAAFSLSVPQDYGLIAAGLAGLVQIFVRQPARPTGLL